MSDARTFAHGRTKTCRFDGSPGIPHSRNCDDATALIEARDAEHAADRAAVRDATLEEAAKEVETFVGFVDIATRRIVAAHVRAMKGQP